MLSKLLLRRMATKSATIIRETPQKYHIKQWKTYSMSQLHIINLQRSKPYSSSWPTLPKTSSAPTLRTKIVSHKPRLKCLVKDLYSINIYPWKPKYQPFDKKTMQIYPLDEYHWIGIAYLVSKKQVDKSAAKRNRIRRRFSAALHRVLATHPVSTNPGLFSLST